MCKFTLIFVFLFTLSGILTQNDETISVRIKYGFIEGKRQSFDGKAFNQFLGIPYAQPPVGSLRFKKPLPMNEWSNTLNAKKWPNSCYHLKEHQGYFSDKMSEDCLYLNIWSPIDSNTDLNDLKPVLFYIHGGGLIIGSSVEKLYSGHVLATNGDIVVVTINYRLNVLGFLYSGTDDVPGNMGLWDQTLALEWVNDNIQYFGGDPSRITIAGESAGSVSTSAHILSPFSRHLFKNAILMSGSVGSIHGVCHKESLLKRSKEYAKTIGCSDENEISGRLSPNVIECLKNKDIDDYKFTSITLESDCITPILLDGTFIPESPLKMLENNDFKQNFNLLMGSTQDEGSFILPWGLGEHFEKDNPPRMDYEKVMEYFYSYFNYMIPDFEEGDKVARLYFQGLSNNTPSNYLLRNVGIALGDLLLGCPTILFGRTLFERNHKINVFQYYFNSKAGKSKLICSEWMGVCHADDIYPLFGLPFSDRENYIEEERKVSQEMMQLFSSFVRSGRPSIESLPEWHQYYKINDKIITPFYEITDKETKDSNFGFGHKFIECEYVWKKYISPNL